MINGIKHLVMDVMNASNMEETDDIVAYFMDEYFWMNGETIQEQKKLAMDAFDLNPEVIAAFDEFYNFTMSEEDHEAAFDSMKRRGGFCGQ